jgi:hypothetical protein
MSTIMGTSGQVGSAVGENLLAPGRLNLVQPDRRQHQNLSRRDRCDLGTP